MTRACLVSWGVIYIIFKKLSSNQKRKGRDVALLTSIHERGACSGCPECVCCSTQIAVQMLQRLCLASMSSSDMKKAHSFQSDCLYSCERCLKDRERERGQYSVDRCNGGLKCFNGPLRPDECGIKFSHLKSDALNE